MKTVPIQTFLMMLFLKLGTGNTFDGELIIAVQTKIIEIVLITMWKITFRPIII